MKTIGEFISSTAETVKQNVPGTSQLKNAYNYSSSTVTNVVKADKVKYLKHIGDWITDDTKSNTALYATKFAQNAGSYALKEGYKLIPGRTAIGEILTKTLNDVKSKNASDKKLEAMEKKKDKLEKQVQGDGGGGGGVESKNASDKKLEAMEKKKDKLVNQVHGDDGVGGLAFESNNIHQNQKIRSKL